ncbi:MAG: chemotaxis protein CheW [Methylomonas sp.]|jgi:purine-binding chemotaxis protein CheW|uniref:chemotaxis protein CheW n=1 Tax=Methylomonas sp. TaxID=418 RepID=UPI0025ED5739|nr:chemotaxis protein CheW [Methylomonas sp.]MCK9604942.1 chemotaxis protein CheW [Methylomonas sp.]
MTDEATSDAHAEQFLTFELAGEAYGIEILKVQEIRGWEPIRKIPNTPAYLKGALNLRGSIVPIVDLRERFNMEKIEYTPTTVVIVMCIHTENNGSTVMGIVADAVSDVLDIHLNEIKASPNLGAKIDTRYIRGMYVGKKNMIMLLDVDKLLNPDEFMDIAVLPLEPEHK